MTSSALVQDPFAWIEKGRRLGPADGRELKVPRRTSQRSFMCSAAQSSPDVVPVQRASQFYDELEPTGIGTALRLLGLASHEPECLFPTTRSVMPLSWGFPGFDNGFPRGERGLMSEAVSSVPLGAIGWAPCFFLAERTLGVGSGPFQGIRPFVASRGAS